MCGDGANDCGALRAAHVGVSLSEAESSVASPFISKVPDIRSVLMVIRQGRAALVTSFGIFKFMVAYSLTEFLSVIVLYSIDTNLTDFEFLFIDICLAINFAFFFGKTAAYEGRLAAHRPPASLLSLATLTSLALQMLAMTIFQVSAFYGVRHFPWFQPYVYGPTSVDSYENHAVFCVSMFQYIAMAVVFSRGSPYRRPIYTNVAFVCSLALMTAVCAYITLYPADWIVRLLCLKLPPDYHWRAVILFLAAANFAVCFVLETFVVGFLVEKQLRRLLRRPEKSRREFARLNKQLIAEDWPRVKGMALNGGYDNVAFTND